MQIGDRVRKLSGYLKRFDNWIVDWLDSRYYASRWNWSSRIWGKLASRAADRYWRKYGDAPMVHNS